MSIDMDNSMINAMAANQPMSCPPETRNLRIERVEALRNLEYVRLEIAIGELPLHCKPQRQKRRAVRQ